LPALPRLTIGALAERTGSSVPTVRYYEEIGLLPKAQRGPGGNAFTMRAISNGLPSSGAAETSLFLSRKFAELVSLIDNPVQDCSKARDVAELQLTYVRGSLRS